MTTTTGGEAIRTAAPPLPTRLALAPARTSTGLLDGAWWPLTRDLEAELPLLVDALEERWGRLTRVMVNPTRWPVVPRKVAAARHTLHVGRFAELDPDKVILLSHRVGRCDLLVIPPETEPAPAARLMAAAAIPGSLLTAGALLADETVTGRRPPDARDREDVRETGGEVCPPDVRHPVVGARMIPLPGKTRR